MGKLGVAPIERISFLNNHKSAISRDDIMLEWARAYNMAGQEDKAIELLRGVTLSQLKVGSMQLPNSICLLIS